MREMYTAQREYFPHNNITQKHIDKIHRNSDFEYSRHHPFTTVGEGIPPVGFKVAEHIIPVAGKTIERFQYPNENPD